MELKIEKKTGGKDTDTEARSNAFTGRKTLTAALLTALVGVVACSNNSGTPTIQVPKDAATSEAGKGYDSGKAEAGESEDGGVKPTVDGSSVDAEACTILAGQKVCMTPNGPVIVDAATGSAVGDTGPTSTVPVTDGSVSVDGSVVGETKPVSTVSATDGSVVGETGPASTVPTTDGSVVGETGPASTVPTTDGSVVGDTASEGPSCQGTNAQFKGFLNLDQPVQYGTWTITYKGIVASDAGDSLYDLSFACGGQATDQLLPGGVSKIGGQMSVNLTNGGRGAVFATISSN